MSVRVRTDQEVCRLGNDYGRDLAAALVLACSGDGVGDRVKRLMAQVVLDQIGAMVQKLKEAAVPAGLAEIYERAARQGVREGLLESGAINTELPRAA